MLDEGKLQQFVGKMLGDLGGATSIALVRIGHGLGLYKALEGAAPMTSAEFASKANIAERYAREWLSHQAASGYIIYDPVGDTFELPPEQAMVFANENSPFFMMGAFDAADAEQASQPCSWQRRFQSLVSSDMTSIPVRLSRQLCTRGRMAFRETHPSRSPRRKTTLPKISISSRSLTYCMIWEIRLVPLSTSFDL